MDSNGLKGVPAKAASASRAPASVVGSPASVTGTAPSRPFARKVKKKSQENLFVRLRNSAGFTIAVGLLITAIGLISFIPWHNQFSKFMLDIGLITTFFGFFMKVLDIVIKVVTER